MLRAVTQRRVTTSCLGLVCLVGADLAGAQEDVAELLSSPVVTTASHTAETASTAPALATTVSGEDLRRHGIRTLEEAVNFLTLGAASTGSNSHGHSPELGARGVIIPGDEGNHFLLLVNGHAVNDPFHGAARFDRAAGIPIEIVDRVEVMVGPGSVLYGSNAMLGVINVITRDATSYTGGHLVAETDLGVSQRGGVGFGTTFRLGKVPGQITGMVEQYRRRGPDLEVGPQDLGIDPFTGQPVLTGSRGMPGIWQGTIEHSNRADVAGGLLRVVVGDLELTLHARHATTGVPLGGANFDADHNRSIERGIWGDVSYRVALSPVVGITARAYADGGDTLSTLEYSRGSGCLIAGISSCTWEETRVSQWGGVELRASLDWLVDGTLVTTLGVDSKLRRVASKTERLDTVTRAALLARTSGIVDETDTPIGAYLQQTWQPAPWLGLNAGARLDHDVRFDPVVSPRAAAAANPWTNGTVKVIYAEAYRAPGRFETDFSLSTVQARPEALRPDRVSSVEGSFEQAAGSQRWRMAAFSSWWRDLVGMSVLTAAQAQQAVDEGRMYSLLPNSVVVEPTNISRIAVVGMNLGYDGANRAGDLQWGGNLTVARARRTSGAGTDEVAAAPAVFGNARISYDLPGDFPAFGLALFAIGPRPADRAFDGNFTPRPSARAQYELRLNVSGPTQVLEGLSYRISANALVADHGAYVVGPTQSSTVTQRSAELNPLSQTEVFLGLSYDFLE